MIILTELFSEIRNTYSNGIDKFALTCDKLSHYVNSALLELSKEEYLGFNDVIDIKLTTDKNYFLGKNVIQIEKFFKYDPATNTWVAQKFDTNLNSINSILKRNEQNIWFNNPQPGSIYRFYVKSTISFVDPSIFVDIVTYKLKDPNSSVNTLLKTDDTKTTKYEFVDLIKTEVIHNNVDRYRISNDVNIENIIDIQTELSTNIKYYVLNSVVSFYTFFINLIVNSIQTISEFNVLYKIKSIKFNNLDSKYFDYPEWLLNYVFPVNLGDFQNFVQKNGAVLNQVAGQTEIILKGIKDAEIVIGIDDVTTQYSSLYTKDNINNYKWEYITSQSVNFIQSNYIQAVNEEDSPKIAEYKLLLSHATIFNKLSTQKDYEYLRYKDSEIDFNLGAIKNILNIPIVFKEFILLFIANRIYLSYNSNSNEYRTIYYQAYKEELFNLLKKGYRKYDAPILTPEEQSNGFL